MMMTEMQAKLDDHGVQPAPGGEQLYSVAEVARLFELPEGRIRYWSQTGFIMPSVREGKRRFYTFRDLISIKVAKELLDAGLPLQRVRRSLDALRVHLPRVDAPLARLRIRSDRERILVEEGETTFDATTGQLLLDFDVDTLRRSAAEVVTLPWVGGGQKNKAPEPEAGSAYDAFQRGLSEEQKWDGLDVHAPAFERALAAYAQAAELDPHFAAAWTNYGSLLALTGELERARDCFDQALCSDPEQPEARCNLAELALRGGEIELAISGFRHVLLIDPDNLEAHYGLARALLEVGGNGQALGHLERFCKAVDRLPDHEANDDLLLRKGQVERVIVALRSEL
ncbi:MerR family transcriptional regulator [Pseudenhygromyxa sp. WMMC2535]|uniref:helix-turn-helix domain-containing protein n=1 Tax=Pseudenhygromyxa sp. WMMC2535 TaxID=2712867 RepID=UPI001554B5D2|nr:helix-turn-helix domain-containing protein [Pseudenhygromyxa sp. WMMC2535]NVB37384.1 MerR family transcriptional regulator [Pseudenhygromyxa sp. WMMC2535]